MILSERSSSPKLKDAARITTVTTFSTVFFLSSVIDHFSTVFFLSSVIDHYAKDDGPGGGRGAVLHVVFTMILCSSNFSIW